MLRISFLSNINSFISSKPSQIDNPQKKTSEISSTVNNDEGQPTVMIDCDEAVDSFVKLYKVGKEFFQKGSFDGLIQELKAKAEHLARKPWEYLTINPPESLFARCALGAVLSASIIAFYGSWHNRRQATDKHQELSAQEKLQEEKLQKLVDAIEAFKGPLQNGAIKSVPQVVELIEKEQACQQQTVNTVKCAIKMNRLDKQISQAALAISSTTLVKALMELMARSALTGPLALAVIVPGVISKLLELSGTINTIVMGKNLVKKSKEFQQSSVATRHEQIRNHIDDCLETEKTSVDEEDLTSYVDSIQAALMQQEEFANAFLNWNLGYFIGSIIYAMSVITNAVLIIASIAGAVALASYPVLGALFIMSTIGSLTMALCTKQFFFDYDKQKGYDSSESKPDPELDRDFLISVDIRQNKKAGLALRAAFSKQVNEREELRRQLCEEAEKALPKFLGFIGLSQSSLKKWLETNTNHDKQIMFMQGALKAQRDYLIQKITVREKIKADLPDLSDLSDDDKKTISDLGVLENNQSGENEDKALLVQVKLLLDDLNNLKKRSDDPSSTQSIETIQQRFIAVQQGQIAITDQDFAEYLLNTAPKRYQDLVGIHLSIAEVHARQLYDLFNNPNTPTPVIKEPVVFLNNNGVSLSLA